ncbi:MAG: hypothetical protein AAFX94_04155 [Myxococcota bacterium]
MRAWIVAQALLFAAPAAAAEQVGLFPVDTPESPVASELAAELAFGLGENGFDVVQGRRLAKATKTPPSKIAERCRGRLKCMTRQVRKNRLDRMVFTTATRTENGVEVTLRVVAGTRQTRATLTYNSRGDLLPALDAVWEQVFGIAPPTAFAPVPEAPSTAAAGDDGLALIPLEPLSPEPEATPDSEAPAAEETPELSEPAVVEPELELPVLEESTPLAEPAPPDPGLIRMESSWKTWTGVATLALGLGAGGFALSRYQSLVSEADELNADESLSQPDIAAEQSRIDDEMSDVNLAIAVSAVLAATGAGLILWDALSEDEPSVDLTVAPTGAGVTVRF